MLAILKDHFELILMTHFVFISAIIFLKLSKKKQKDALVLRKSNPDEVIACCHDCKDEIVK